MGNETDIDRFVKEPALLIKLCREVIDRIDSGPKESKAGEKDAQLREIAKAIERLENMNVAVPDPLRAEKTRLVTELGYQDQIQQNLRFLSVELGEILKELNGRLGRNSPPPIVRKSKERPRSKKKGHTNHGVSLLDLLEAGYISVEDRFEIRWLKNGPGYEGKILSDGTVMAETKNGWKQSTSLSTAASQIAGRSLNGWSVWRRIEDDGRSTPLSKVRSQYLKKERHNEVPQSDHRRLKVFPIRNGDPFSRR